MVDTHALGACAARRGGSTPFIRTIFEYELMVSTTFYTTLSLVRFSNGAIL